MGWGEVVEETEEGAGDFDLMRFIPENSNAAPMIMNITADYKADSADHDEQEVRKQDEHTCGDTQNPDYFFHNDTSVKLKRPNTSVN